MIARLAMGILIAGATGTGAWAEVSLRDRQSAACYDDVQKFCGAFVPDSVKVEDCMSKMKTKVSAKCRKFYEP